MKKLLLIVAILIIGIAATNEFKQSPAISFISDTFKKAQEKNEWEEFTRLKLATGGDLRKYYPLNAEAEAEYTAWLAEQKASASPQPAATRPRKRTKKAE